MGVVIAVFLHPLQLSMLRGIYNIASLRCSKSLKSIVTYVRGHCAKTHLSTNTGAALVLQWLILHKHQNIKMYVFLEMLLGCKNNLLALLYNIHYCSL